MQQLQLWLPLISAVFVVIGLISLLQWGLISRHPSLTSEQRLPRQMIIMVSILIGTIAIVLSLPVSESSRNQVLALMGVLISGVIAFSSTTIVSNLMSGLVLRFNKPFRTGDFIRCNDYFGRVSEKGLLETEIQTEQRDLIAIANSYLVNNPVSVVRSSGTIVTTTLSIGYDVHHAVVSSLLVKATEKAGLEDGFVHVTELGNFSVHYQVAGLLTEVKSLLTARSKLNKAILDTLHEGGVEIMSPTIMAPRAVEASQRFIPTATQQSTQSVKSDSEHEDVAFDKAEQAEQQELSILDLQTKIATLKNALPEAEGDRKEQLTQQIEQYEKQLSQLIQHIEESKADAHD